MLIENTGFPLSDTDIFKKGLKTLQTVNDQSHKLLNWLKKIIRLVCQKWMNWLYHGSTKICCLNAKE